MKGSFELKSKLLGILSTLVSFTVLGALAFILFDIARHGLSGLSWSFLVDEPANAGRTGGIGPIILSTAYILLIAMAVSLPIGLATALWLSEFTKTTGPFAEFVRKSLDILAGVPSIVFGLFGNAFFCVYLGMGFSILSGGLTLACMVLPILIRVTEESFRSVPIELRQGTAALGMSKTSNIFFIMIPVAFPGLLAGTLLGFGRAIAETAALIFTSGYVDRWPESAMDSGRSLSVHIYDLAMNVPGGDAQAYATSLYLVIILLLVGGCSSLLVGLHLRKKGFQYE